MNLCDDLNDNSQINLGEENIFSIPQTLRFVATINNDHTTETLSPRLIDRSWVVTLPLASAVSEAKEIPSERIETISWKLLHDAFGATGVPPMVPEVRRIYDEIIQHLRGVRLFVSPRTETAIKRYWIIATKYFEKGEYGAEPAVVALDYAVAQKILPKISGNGEFFSKSLEEMIKVCGKNSLAISEGILRDIEMRGKENMNYYQFFK